MSSSTPTKDRPSAWGGGLLPQLLIVGFALLEGVRYQNYAFDDAYIYLRVVGNIAHGTWGYNLGQVYNCSTSPAYPLLLLVLSGFGALSSFRVAHLAAAVGIAAFGLCVHRCLLPRGRAVACLAGLAAVGALARNGSWGLEYHVVWGLVGAALLALFRGIERQEGPSPALGALLGLSVLGRPDLAAFAAITLLWWYLALPREARSARPFLVAGLCAGLTILPWVAFSYHTFGQVFPATLAAKRWQGASGLWGGGRLLYFSGFRTYAGALAAVPKPAYVTGLIGAAMALRERSPFTPLFLFCAVQQSIYLLMNIPGYFWYYQPIDVCAVVGTGYLLSSPRLASRLPALGRGGRLALGAVAAAVLIGWSVRPLPLVITRLDDADYAGVAGRLCARAEGRPRSVAATEVGILGYFSGLPIVDLCGLTTPNPPYLVARNLDRYYAAPADYLLLHVKPWPQEAALRTDPRLREVYADPVPLSEGDRAVELYVRRGLPDRS